MQEAWSAVPEAEARKNREGLEIRRFEKTKKKNSDPCPAQIRALENEEEGASPNSKRRVKGKGIKEKESGGSLTLGLQGIFLQLTTPRSK